MKRAVDYRSLLGEDNPLPRYPRLLEAAINEFSRKKYDDASLNDILKEAAMSKGSLYHNFGDKFGLYLCIMDVIVKRKVEFFTAFMRDRQVPGDFFGTFRLLVLATMEFLFADERLHHLFNRNIEAGQEFIDRILPYFPMDWNTPFLPLIRGAIESGQIDRRFTPEFVAKVLEILLGNANKLMGDVRMERDALAVIDQLMDLIRHGVGAGKESAT